MAKKAVIINVAVNDSKAVVTYDTGTEKVYLVDKLPKTVTAWLAEHEQEPDQNEPEVILPEPEKAELSVPVALPENKSAEARQLPKPGNLPPVQSEVRERPNFATCVIATPLLILSALFDALAYGAAVLEALAWIAELVIEELKPVWPAVWKAVSWAAECVAVYSINAAYDLRCWWKDSVSFRAAILAESRN